MLPPAHSALAVLCEIGRRLLLNYLRLYVRQESLPFGTKAISLLAAIGLVALYQAYISCQKQKREREMRLLARELVVSEIAPTGSKCCSKFTRCSTYAVANEVRRTRVQARWNNRR